MNPSSKRNNSGCQLTRQLRLSSELAGPPANSPLISRTWSLESGDSCQRPLPHNHSYVEGVFGNGTKEICSEFAGEKQNRKKIVKQELGIKLTQRDLELLKLCFEQRFLLVEHVIQFFPEKWKKASASRRIKQLSDAGLIRTLRVPQLGNFLLIRITELGLVHVEHLVFGTKDRIPSISPWTIHHDAFLTSVRLVLMEKYPHSIWEPETALEGDQSEYTFIPDGIIRFSKTDAIMVEAECTIKKQKDYRDRLNYWDNQNDISKILYVARNELIERRLRTLFSSIHIEKSLELTTLERLRREQLARQSIHGAA